MKKGDNILINYNTDNNIKKVATFIKKEDNKNYFVDISGKFILTDNFIGNKGITLTVLEDF